MPVQSNLVQQALNKKKKRDALKTDGASNKKVKVFTGQTPLTTTSKCVPSGPGSNIGMVGSQKQPPQLSAAGQNSYDALLFNNAPSQLDDAESLSKELQRSIELLVRHTLVCGSRLKENTHKELLAEKADLEEQGKLLREIVEELRAKNRMLEECVETDKSTISKLNGEKESLIAEMGKQADAFQKGKQVVEKEAISNFLKSERYQKRLAHDITPHYEYGIRVGVYQAVDKFKGEYPLVQYFEPDHLQGAFGALVLEEPGEYVSDEEDAMSALDQELV